VLVGAGPTTRSNSMGLATSLADRLTVFNWRPARSGRPRRHPAVLRWSRVRGPRGGPGSGRW